MLTQSVEVSGNPSMNKPAEKTVCKMGDETRNESIISSIQKFWCAKLKMPPLD